MRRLLALILPVLFVAAAGTGAAAAVRDAFFLGVPTAVAAKVQVHRGDPRVLVTWTDTNATIARSDIRRRSTAADTFWNLRGYTRGTVGEFSDESVTCGKTYRYQVRDSISGQAKSAWSDSASVTVTCQTVSPT